MRWLENFSMSWRKPFGRSTRHQAGWTALLLLAGCLACSGPRQTVPVIDTAQDTQTMQDAQDTQDAAPQEVTDTGPSEVGDATDQPVSESTPTVPTIAYAIQVGAFSTAQRASAYAVQLQGRGLDTYYVIDDDGLFKVRFGRFGTHEKAVRQGDLLKAEGAIDSFFIVEPLPDQHHPHPTVVLRDTLVTTARRFLGTPYQWGASAPEKGFDCSGLTMTVYRLNGLDLPRTALAQFHSGTAVEKQQVQVGDLLFFDISRNGRADHVGIYCGESRFIHAPGQGKTVRTASLANRYFVKRYMGARRYF